MQSADRKLGTQVYLIPLIWWILLSTYKIVKIARCVRSRNVIVDFIKEASLWNTRCYVDKLQQSPFKKSAFSVKSFRMRKWPSLWGDRAITSAFRYFIKIVSHRPANVLQSPTAHYKTPVNSESLSVRLFGFLHGWQGSAGSWFTQTMCFYTFSSLLVILYTT